jgi:histidinol-phosphate aminotransferase
MDDDTDKVARWVRPEIRALAPYHVPDAGGLIKLDAMENPYPWPAWLVEEWLATLREVSLNRYPDPAARALKTRLREAMGVPSGMDVLLGNGSDELIQMIALTVAVPGRVVLAPEPSFVMYRMIATLAGMEYRGVALRDGDFGLDMPVMREAIARHTPVVVFLAYPNNPTGNLFDRSDVLEIVATSPGLVVLDEAYTAFAEDSFMAALGAYDNLLVLRTVSKIGLAGLRLGLLAGPRAWLDEIEKTRLPYNINVLTQASAQFALGHGAVFDEQTRRIREDREALSAALRTLPGLQVYDSRANFVLVRTPAGRAGAVFRSLKGHGVLVKNLSGAGAALSDCLRITVGTPQENEACLAALRASL